MGLLASHLLQIVLVVVVIVVHQLLYGLGQLRNDVDDVDVVPGAWGWGRGLA